MVIKCVLLAKKVRMNTNVSIEQQLDVRRIEKRKQFKIRKFENLL